MANFLSCVWEEITNVKENSFMVKIAENVEIEVDKGSISHKVGGM